MTESLFVTSSIIIKAPASKVWNALVSPEQTKKYMFGCETVSDWKPGSSLLWKGEYEGKEMVFVKGNVVKMSPGNILVYTTFDPNSTMPDIPANYLTVTYQLEESGNETILVVTQGDFAHVAEGQKRYQDAFNDGEGWNPILAAIKNLLESES